MTVAELIERLNKFDVDATVYVYGGDDCDHPVSPTPEYCDWGNVNHPERGVYL